MKNILLVFITLAALVGCGKKEGSPKEATAADSASSSAPVIRRKPLAPDTTGMRDGYLIHLSSGPADPFKVCLALKMASDLSAENDVMLYFDHKGTEIALKETKEIEFSPFPSTKKLMEELVAYNVKLRVCEPCLKAIWKKKEDVINGIESLKPGEISEISGGRIITLTY